MTLSPIIASATLAVLAPTATPTPEPLAVHHAACPSSEVIVRGRKLLISGGVIAGTGLLSATLGFAVLGGINAGNPGRPFELEFDDPIEARRTLKLSNTMTGIGVVGASLLISGTIVAIIGGVTRRRVWKKRFPAVMSPSPLGVVVSF